MQVTISYHETSEPADVRSFAAEIAGFTAAAIVGAHAREVGMTLQEVLEMRADQGYAGVLEDWVEVAQEIAGGYLVVLPQDGESLILVARED